MLFVVTIMLPSDVISNPLNPEDGIMPDSVLVYAEKVGVPSVVLFTTF